MKTTACGECGANAKVVRGSYPFKESGLPNVVLQGIDLIRCPKCRTTDPVIPRVNVLLRLLVVAVVSKPYRLVGEEVRFLRKYLRMSGEEFSHLIHVDKTTLSKWENNEDPISHQSDRLIRAVTLALGEGLKEKLEEIVRLFGQIEESRSDLRIDINPGEMSYKYA